VFWFQIRVANDDISLVEFSLHALPSSYVLSGQARQKLADLGRPLKAAIPTVIMGKNHTTKHVTTYPIIAIPFSTDNGEFTVEVYFEA
jgi:CheY-specific phosphatase CheX